MTNARNTPLDRAAVANAAVKFRDSLIEKADQMAHGKYPLWHGWAIYDAFIAGAAFAQKKWSRK